MSELHDINAIHADALDAELAGDGDLHTLVEPLLHLLAAVAVHEPGPWVERAACRGLPTEWWFPTRGDPTDTAMTICHTCPVQSECTEHALAIGNDAFGIWGGLSGRQRNAIRRTRQTPTTCNECGARLITVQARVDRATSPGEGKTKPQLQCSDPTCETRQRANHDFTKP